MPTRIDRRPVAFNHLTGRHEYSEAQAAAMAAESDRAHAATVARNAAKLGVSAEEMAGGAYLFDAFTGL